MRGTIKDVASLARVSVQTVSNVVNQRPVVRAETHARVMAACRALNYTPNAAARGLATGTRHVVGIIVPYLANPRYGEILTEINSALRERSYATLISDSRWNPEIEVQIARTLIEQAVDGVVLASSGLEGEGARLLQQAGIPVVLLFNQPREHGFDAYLVDSQGGSFAVTRHLLALGHRRIAFLRGPAVDFSLRRERGYREAMAAHGLEVVPEWVATFAFDIGGGYDGGMHLLGQPERPTAIVCSNDVLACGALDAATDLGLDVPGDVAITGFDDIYIAAMRRVRLTTLGYDYAGLARQAVNRLVHRLDGHADDPPVTVKIPCEIIVRNSCGAQAAVPAAAGDVPWP